MFIANDLPSHRLASDHEFLVRDVILKLQRQTFALE